MRSEKGNFDINEGKAYLLNALTIAVTANTNERLQRNIKKRRKPIRQWEEKGIFEGRDKGET